MTETTFYGPILAMPGGYGYSTWSRHAGRAHSFIYGRLDHARDALRREVGVKTETVEEFENRISQARGSAAARIV
ncbi:MAG TPA: hypothetical protein VL574_13860 [Stellaceae bacterium]|nr:hypothetical protein [Stellaceae bacterium]